MKVWGGWVFTREGFVEGWLNPLTKELGFGQAVDPIKRGVIFPAFRNFFNSFLEESSLLLISILCSFAILNSWY